MQLGLYLFSDACSSQNKNFIVLCCLKNFVQTSVIFKAVKHFFPIRGHSSLPPNQVFGRIEKVVRKKEAILSPVEYYRIFSEYGTVQKLREDRFLKDNQKMAKQILKKKNAISNKRSESYNLLSRED